MPAFDTPAMYGNDLRDLPPSTRKATCSDCLRERPEGRAAFLEMAKNQLAEFQSAPLSLRKAIAVSMAAMSRDGSRPRSGRRHSQLLTQLGHGVKPAIALTGANFSRYGVAR